MNKFGLRDINELLRCAKLSQEQTNDNHVNWKRFLPNWMKRKFYLKQVSDCYHSLKKTYTMEGIEAMTEYLKDHYESLKQKGELPEKKFNYLMRKATKFGYIKKKSISKIHKKPIQKILSPKKITPEKKQNFKGTSFSDLKFGRLLEPSTNFTEGSEATSEITKSSHSPSSKLRNDDQIEAYKRMFYSFQEIDRLENEKFHFLSKIGMTDLSQIKFFHNCSQNQTYAYNGQKEISKLTHLEKKEIFRILSQETNFSIKTLEFMYNKNGQNLKDFLEYLFFTKFCFLQERIEGYNFKEAEIICIN